LFSCVYGGDLLISTEDGDVFVPKEGLSVPASRVAPAGVPVVGPLPPEAAHVLSMPEAQRGVVVYQELPLTSGDAVRLQAMVEEVPHPGGAYRARGDVMAPFRARPDLGRTVIDDEPL